MSSNILHKTAAQDRQAREPIPQPQFAQSIGYKHVNVRERSTGAAPARAEVEISRQGRDFFAALCVAWSDDQHAREPLSPDACEALQDEQLFARVRACGEDNGSFPQGGGEGAQFRGLSRQRCPTELQISQTTKFGAQAAQLKRGGFVARQDQVERAENRPSSAWNAAPTPNAGVRNAGRNQRHPRAGSPRFQDKIWPKLTLGEHSQIGPPMVQEPADRPRCVDRRILVQDPRRHARRQNVGRSPCRRRDQDSGRRPRRGDVCG